MTSFQKYVLVHVVMRTYRRPKPSPARIPVVARRQLLLSHTSRRWRRPSNTQGTIKTQPEAKWVCMKKGARNNWANTKPNNRPVHRQHRIKQYLPKCGADDALRLHKGAVQRVRSLGFISLLIILLFVGFLGAYLECTAFVANKDRYGNSDPFDPVNKLIPG